MFESVTAKPTRRGRLLVGASLLAHAVVGAAVLVAGMWEIKELHRPHRGVAAAASIPQSRGGGASNEAQEQRIVKKATKTEVRNTQPNRHDMGATETTGTGDSSGGNVSGSGGTGDSSGPGTGQGLGISLCTSGDCNSDLTVPEVQRKPETLHVGPAVLSKLERVGGDAQIQPPTETKSAMQSRQLERLSAVLEMCLDQQGAVSSIKVLKSSGFAEYDARLQSGVRRWRYKPYRINGSPTAICAQINFVYRQTR